MAGEKNPAAVALGKLAMAKRTPEERAELERKRQAGYAKLTLPERRAAARKAWRSRRWWKAPVPTVKSSPATALEQQAAEMLEAFDSMSDAELLELATAMSARFPAE